MKTYVYFFLLAILASVAFYTQAKPAKPGIMTITTADGDTLSVRLVGDEFFHQYFTTDGFPIIEKNGNFFYCDYDAAGNVVDSNLKVLSVAKRTSAEKTFLERVDKATLENRIRAYAKKSPRRASAVNFNNHDFSKAPARTDMGEDGPPFERGYGLFPDLRFPAYGNQKAIVILVEYTDVKFNTSYDAKDYFTRMLNEDNFSDLGATGSAAQYFRENSKGAFCPEFDVYGPVQLAHNQAYYGGNNWWGDDTDPAAMVKEACDALDATVDFSDYDRNNDGVVDNIFIFYAGRGEASGGSANSVWPHSWNMNSAGYPNLYYDGVRVHTYGCSNEWEVSYGGGRPDGVGTFIHEFSHVMGLPDLYATSYTSAFTPGEWSALDYGPYNNDGMTPPNYGAFERYALGWIKPREIDHAVSATLQPIGENVCGIIRSAKDTEFFLVENRQQTGWDTYIPHHGMLIWHIDYNANVWSQNTVNNSASHQYVDIEEADGSQSDFSVSGDPFPGTSNKTSFTASTTPAMKTWSGTGLNFPITDIAENGEVITFNVLGGSDSELSRLQTYDATDVGADSFTLTWNEPLDGNDVLLSIYSFDESGQRIYFNGYQNYNVGHITSVTITDAEPETTYYFTVVQTNGWETSLPSDEKAVFTGRLTIDYYNVVALSASEVANSSFIANWQPLEDATGYDLSVYTKVEGGPKYDETGFDAGIADLGEWVVSSNVTTYGMASYAGVATPSLRIPSGSSVTTPVFDDYISELYFWHRGNSTSDGDRIDVYADTPNGRLLVTEVPVVKEAGGTITDLSDLLPEETTRVQIQFIRLGDKGYLAIDDIKVGHGHEFEAAYLPGFLNHDVGDVLSYTVDGLNANTDYYYTVRATDGLHYSKVSSEIKVTTSDVSSGINAPLSDSAGLNVSGLTVYSDSNEEIVAYDLTGVTIAKGVHEIILPGHGFYIVSLPATGFVQKLIIK